jgi:hypothetical protein
VLLLGCGDDDATTGGGGAGGSGSASTTEVGSTTSGTTVVSSSSTGTFCAPGEARACYTGPAGTEGVGICAPGSEVCDEGGAAFGPCSGDVTPQRELCETPEDEDCDGEAPVCSGNTLWSKHFGDVQIQLATGIAADATGDVVVVGSLRGTMDLGGGQLASAGGADVLVAKLDPAGDHLWSARFGDSSWQLATGVAVDAAGNLAVIGTFSGSVDFGGGALTSAGESDVFVAKLDPNGAHLWSKRFGESTLDQEGASIAFDADGNVVLAGVIKATVDFGGGPLTSAGGFDGFAVKLDADGSHLWSKRFGDVANDAAAHIATDALGNVLLTGNFQGTIDLGGAPLTSGGDADVLITKLDADGNHLWSKAAGGPLGQAGVCIATDADGNGLIVGDFSGSIDFGGGALTAAGGTDSFVVKLDAAGDLLWSKRFGTSSMHASNVAVDGAGNPVLVGRFTQSVDFGGGALTAAGGFDLFAAKLDEDGNHVWSRRMGDVLAEQPWSVAVDPTDHVLLAGAFEGTVDFGNGPLQSAGSTDGFVMKMAP